ncbi:MAG: purine-binding chemotaxis protein CheW [Butyricicoccus pullicaecorum]|nr:purine-binding chemotaxis protein CheW [Butyricicoccus pullicaecorum]
MPTESIDTIDALKKEHVYNDAMAKYLTFYTDNLLFGVNASYVVEIIINHALTSLPMTPDYVKGIINLRGQIIPIIDIRLRIGRPEAETDSTVCIIVLDIEGTQIGILVDRVAQMVDIDESQLSVSLVSDQQLVSGMISLEDGGNTMLVLDCARMISEV